MPGPGDHLSKLESVLAHTDVFLPNDDEAEALTGLREPLAQAERFAALGAKAVVITCGERGSVLVSGQTRLRAGTHAVECIGATGAGDAFDAGLIAGLLAGEDLAVRSPGPAPWERAACARSARPMACSHATKRGSLCAAHPLKLECI